MTVTPIDRTASRGRTRPADGGQGLDFAVDVRSESRAKVVTVRGELDIATVPLLMTVLGTAGDRCPTRVELDLSGVTFADCYALGALATRRAGLPAGRRFTLRNPSPFVTRVLALTGLDADLGVAGRSEPGAAVRRAS